MIPIRDNIRSSNYPIINYLIIVLCVIAFIWELSLKDKLDNAFMIYGIVPAKYSDPLISSHLDLLDLLIPFVTSMFLHGGFMHILGNMWFLFIFGDNVEDRLGHIRYLIFYILSGIAAGIIHLLTNWNSRIPTIGASGAIAGVMGAYFVLYPRAKVLTLMPIFFFLQFVEIPAFLFLGIWFIFQLLSAAATQGQYGGIAWWAHIGGFISGIILLKIFTILPERRNKSLYRSYTRRRASPLVQPIRPWVSREDLDIYGEIAITEREAIFGATKIISVPYGFKKKIYRVIIPPGLEDGSVIRLRGAGRRIDNDAGDLHLRVRIV
jgi:membrane associated rhomboid family serine protease